MTETAVRYRARLGAMLLSATLTLLGGCAQPEAPGETATDGARSLRVEPVRIAVLRFQHETCTFCPGGDVTVEDWTRTRPPDRGEAVLTAGDYVRGFTAAAREYAGVELIGLTSPDGVFGGSSRSWSTRETFEHFMGTMIEELRAAAPVDGVYLALHGAMAVRDLPRPEAEIARRVREVVGPDVPIAATFDLHGNEDEEFLRWADASFVTKRYPHYDTAVQGGRAARLLLRMIRGSYDAATATRRPGVITPTVLQWTGEPPAVDIMERARRWESRETDVFVSVFFGFPWSDVPDVGATVQVMTNGDQALADRIADDMNDYIWRRREAFFERDLLMPEDAVAQARADLDAGNGPVVLADYSDRNGDSTWILEQVLEQALPGVLIGTVRDEGVIDALIAAEAQAGDPFDMPVGGFAADSSGRPVRVQGELRYFGPAQFRGDSSFDHVAVVEFGDGGALVITPALKQIRWTDELEIGGLDPEDYQVFVLKSRVHFRRGFDETGFAPSIHIVDAPGAFVGTTRLEDLPYEHVTLTDYYPYGLPPARR